MLSKCGTDFHATDRNRGDGEMSEESQFTLSAKVVKQMTKDNLGYELSSNAFELLNQKAKDYLIYGFGVEEVNEWIIKVLNRFKEKKIVRRCDIEIVIEQEVLIKMDESLDNDEIDKVESSFSDADDILVDTVREIDIVQLPTMGQINLIRELEEEIERLKKIIQIILNKQAELV